MTTLFSWCKLADHGVLRFDGADAQSFLQGQLTNDVAALDVLQSQYNGYCTPKGRLLAVMLLWRNADAFDMLLPRELCEPIRKRLSMYVLRSKVAVRDLSSSRVLFGVCGEHAGDAITALGGAAPAAAHGVTQFDAVTVVRLPVQRMLLAVDLAHADTIERALVQRVPASPASLWTALDIEAGIPSVVTATQEAFVPQVVNFDLIHAVSFDKGCYPGQEIVARTRYLGKVKQRMLRARIVSAQTAAPGDKLYSATFGDQACGSIVSAVRTAGDANDVLAVAHLGDINHTDVHWQSPDGPVLQFCPLPYLAP